MIILGIETSCDETAISVVQASGGLKKPAFQVLAQVVSSQAKLHAPFGGVVPMLAKREHGKNLLPLLKEAIKQSKVTGKSKKFNESYKNKLKKILEREPELLEQFLQFIPLLPVPKIDCVAVTRGPGLEPALWVGINFARALALVWEKPLVPVNHMIGHIYSVLASPTKPTLTFPALALLVSGGHTELVLIKNWFEHKVIGRTLDDAVGEAFDKAARVLGLPYPGGPEISKLAKEWQGLTFCRLPRPMLHSGDFNFSFSGLKTAILYSAQKLAEANGGKLRAEDKVTLAYEFEQAAVEVLVKKLAKAVAKFEPRTVIIAGGVAANQELRRQAELMITSSASKLLISDLQLSTDNATMIAIASYLQIQKKVKSPQKFNAAGNLILS